MKEQNLSVVMHGGSLDDLTSYLTEFAQMQRVVGNHSKAEKAETIRNTLYAQHADKL